jgi:hypothetical protein
VTHTAQTPEDYYEAAVLSSLTEDKIRQVCGFGMPGARRGAVKRVLDMKYLIYYHEKKFSRREY